MIAAYLYRSLTNVLRPLIGGADVSLTPSTVSTPYLPFDMPTRDVLAASTHKVWVHWMGGAFPMSVDDKEPATDSTEYWRRYWMPPGSTEGTTNHAAYGGLSRTRKLYTARGTGTGYQVRDRLAELRWMLAAGYDGPTCEMLSVSTVTPIPTTAGSTPQRWGQLMEMLDACDQLADPTFTITLMPDGSVSATADPTNLANAIDAIAGRRVTRIGGRLLIAPYGPERAPNNTATNSVAFWTTVRNRLVVLGHDPVFWFCYTQQWDGATQAPAFDSIAYGHSRWGVRNPVDSASANVRGEPATAHSTYGKPWMVPVSVGDERPISGKFNERRNTEQLRTSWQGAIDAGSLADWVQQPTWDDHAEGANIDPTVESGWFWLDVNAYWLVRYKTGSWPVITRDAIYLSHRRQPVSGVTYTSAAQTQFMVLAGNTTPVDQVEALVFSTTATGTVAITTSAGTTSFDLSTMTAVVPGVYACVVALALGTASATLIRAGTTLATVNSAVTVSTTQPVQDMSYYGASSLR